MKMTLRISISDHDGGNRRNYGENTAGRKRIILFPGYDGGFRVSDIRGEISYQRFLKEQSEILYKIKLKPLNMAEKLRKVRQVPYVCV